MDMNIEIAINCIESKEICPRIVTPVLGLTRHEANVGTEMTSSITSQIDAIITHIDVVQYSHRFITLGINQNRRA
jgi:hypothetical protein